MILFFILMVLLYIWARMAAPSKRMRASDLLRLDPGLRTANIMEMLERTAPYTRHGGNKLTVNVTNGQQDIPGIGHIDPTQPIFFKPGEPTRFDEFGIQDGLVDKLRMQLDSAKPGVPLPPQIFLGVAGMGKTLLAKVLANEQRLRWEDAGIPGGPFLEILGGLDSPDQLDQYLRVAQRMPGTTLFFDEVHELARPIYTRLFELMENGRHKFKGEAHPVVIKVQLIAATTEFGRMDSAFRRRWIKNYFEPATAAQIYNIITNRDFPIDAAAAQLLVDRTHYAGAPWEAIELFNLAKASAGSRNSPFIDVSDVERVFVQEQVDEFGLRRLDRAVIQALLTQATSKVVRNHTEVTYKASEQTVCALAGIDRAEYLEVVRPRLQARALLVVRGGQVLTDDAVARYGHLARDSRI